MSVLTRLPALAAILLFSAATLCTAAETASPGQLFGTGQGYFHPTLQVATEYSDNYKATADNEQSDWKTTVSPGFWIAVPASRSNIFSIVSSNKAPGGKGVSRFQDEEFKGFQGSLMYNADIVRSHDHSDEDVTKHRGQGMLQYAFPGGLALELSDVYIQSADEYDVASGDELDEYNSNLANLVVFYEHSPKLRLRVGYSNYKLDYTSGTDVDYKERTDDQVSSYLIYRVLPKTELFVQYDHINVDYDLDVLADSTEQHLFLGVKFDSNARITGHAKIGYGKYETDNAQDDTFDDFIGEAYLGYAFGSASKLSLIARQSVDITDDDIYQNILHREIGLALSQQLSYKVGATLRAAYKEDEYRFDSDQSGREDDYKVAGVNVSYAMRDWLKLGVDYHYTDRDSNVAIEEYVENRVMFTIAAAF